MKIKRLIVTPIAFRDPPLLNSWGVHEPLALRSIVELHLEDGTVGISEGSGELRTLTLLQSAAEAIRGFDVHATNTIEAVIQALPASFNATPEQLIAAAKNAFSIIEVACLDAQGKLANVSVSELLGGRVRDTVPYSAYLFYKWAEHPGGEPDKWGAAMDPQGIVRQAKRLVQDYGFSSFKLKGGVLAPEIEIATVQALAEAFPGQPLRLDPNGAWTEEVAVEAAERLEQVLEYLEDPVQGTAAMSQVAARISLPLATNMCVVSFATIAPAVAGNAVQIVLADHHVWGGLRHSRELAAICNAFGLGVSMHSNSHLGISLAAMTHLAASTPNLAYDSDTHYPWNADDDIIKPGSLALVDGSVAVPTGPGLGVDIDQDLLAAAHERYLASSRSTRDDTGYMRTIDPDFDPTSPRFARI
ncbi:MAG: enolase C-terminal domain-like protein [Specibacter sp.]